MHSSRMRTARSSSRPGESPPDNPPWSRCPPRAGNPQDQAPPQEQAPPDQAPPEARHPPKQASPDQIPSTFPLAVGLDQIPLHFPLGVDLETPKRPAARHAGIPPAMHAWIAHPPCGQTHTCKHIILPQTSFAGGNKYEKRQYLGGHQPSLWGH